MKEYRRLSGGYTRAKKQLGQNFLIDGTAVQRIVDAAELDKNDVVLEVGPGPGTLTTLLAKLAGQVIAVELDHDMLAPLNESVAHLDNVRVVHGDILEQDIVALVGGGPYKVVGNLPYYITSAVLRHVLEARVRPSLLVTTVQREVALRIVGRAEKRRGGGASRARMSLLAVSIQFYGVPRIVARIPAGAFRPIPSVDSAVVRVDVYDTPPWDPVDEAAFFRTVRAGFAQSRKQLRNALSSNLAVSAELVAQGLATAGVDGTRRAETLTVPEWIAISRSIGGAPDRG